MAAGHYQFEAIHPFTDGNGRTGRVLDPLYLVDQGLLDIPVLHLSRPILRNKSDYYRGTPFDHRDGRLGALAVVHARRPARLDDRALPYRILEASRTVWPATMKAPRPRWCSVRGSLQAGSTQACITSSTKKP
jgi:hypothetical protein